jgi:putative salt-induced outer membrane protein YdiY
MPEHFLGGLDTCFPGRPRGKRMRRSVTLLQVSIVWIVTSVLEAQAPPPRWSSSIGAGLAITSGNSDTQNLNFSANTKYDPGTKFVFKADATYLRGESDGEKQVDKASASARGERSFSERLFAFGEVSYLRDPFKDIDYFIAPVVGAGYRVITSEARNLTVDGALGVQTESNSTLGRTSSGAVKAGENLDWALSPSSKLTQKITGIWKTDDFGDALYHFDAGLVTTVAARLELKLAYLYDYKSKPPVATIEKGDSALFAALLFKF